MRVGSNELEMSTQLKSLLISPGRWAPPPPPEPMNHRTGGGMERVKDESLALLDGEERGPPLHLSHHPPLSIFD